MSVKFAKRFRSRSAIANYRSWSATTDGVPGRKYGVQPRPTRAALRQFWFRAEHRLRERYPDAIGLPAKWVRRLRRTPETGAGFQSVSVHLARTEGFVSGTVFNAALLILDGPTPAVGEGRVNAIRLRPDARISGASGTASGASCVSATTPTAASLAKPGGTALEAKDAPVDRVADDEQFRRFSAFMNDRRVRRDGSVRPGTYATTESDAVAFILTGTHAVGRYALANKMPAIHHWRISPRPGTRLQRGTVAPAFGEPGGGVEVYFLAGTHKRTVSRVLPSLPPV